jgi:UDP:flavonoid glycosyltransferase YjiC (YdhE family)
VLSLGGADQQIPTTLPGDPIVVPYAPQLQLLERTAVVITHAGLNTALESLSHGVPMVAIPITNEQPGVAARIGRLGAGEVIPPAKLSASQCATRLREAIAQADGLRRAADIAEQALSTQRPVVRQQKEPSRLSTYVG